jgi:hypothetical protein
MDYDLAANVAGGKALGAQFKFIGLDAHRFPFSVQILGQKPLLRQSARARCQLVN